MKILAGVLVHRATRPLRGSVSCGSGWPVPCVEAIGLSIQLTLSQDDDQCALHVPQGPGTGDRSYLLGGTGRPVIRTVGMGADRCSVAGTGGGSRILENPRRCVSPPSGATAVTAPVCPVFRVVPVAAACGWSACVSIQLTLTQNYFSRSSSTSSASAQRLHHALATGRELRARRCSRRKATTTRVWTPSSTR